MSNDYGSVTAKLNVNPDVNALRHGGLSHGLSGQLRASLQRKVKRPNDNQCSNGHGSQNGHYIDHEEEEESGMTL